MTSQLQRRNFLQLSAATGPVLLGLSRSADAREPLRATVKVAPEPVHALPLTQYGHFIEHLGMCIEGGIWDERDDHSLLGGVRPQLIEAMRSIHPSLIRYPGGCFADGYHWQDGVGPRASRPRRRNKAWGKWGPLVGPTDDNHFGTDEFLALCEAVGAAPMLTANVGSGTAEEAAAWVEYCNGSPDTRWGAERAKNGHREPYGVNYWFVGNEIFGWYEIGYQTPEVYVKTFRAYAEAMRRVDPTLKLIAVGQSTPQNKIMLEGAGDVMDYLSIHQYAPLPKLYNTLRFQFSFQKGWDLKSIYYEVMGSLAHMTQFVESSVRDVRSFSPAGKKVPLSLDEWNLWFNFFEDVVLDDFCLRDGLWTASVLNLFHRHAPDLPLANIAQMVNCLGIIRSTRRGTYLTPSALAFKLYTENAGSEWLASAVESPALPGPAAELPALDVSTTRGDGHVALFLVNRHRDRELTAAVSLPGLEFEPSATRLEMHHPNPVRYNSYRRPEAVTITSRPETLAFDSAGGFSVHLPAHSLVCLKLALKKGSER